MSWAGGDPEGLWSPKMTVQNRLHVGSSAQPQRQQRRQQCRADPGGFWSFIPRSESTAGWQGPAARPGQEQAEHKARLPFWQHKAAHTSQAAQKLLLYSSKPSCCSGTDNYLCKQRGWKRAKTQTLWGLSLKVRFFLKKWEVRMLQLKGNPRRKSLPGCIKWHSAMLACPHHPSITELFGSERTSKILQFQTPAMGRDCVLERNSLPELGCAVSSSNCA